MSEATATAPPPPGAAPSGARAAWAKLRQRIGWRAHIEMLREPQLFLLLSVIIGLISGLFVVLFRIAIDWTRITLFGSSLAPPAARTVLIPVLGGLVVAFLVVRFFPRARGSGVNQTKAAVYIYNGYIPFNTVIGKFICCALAIGRRPVAGTGRSVTANGSRHRLGTGAALTAITREGAPDRSRGRGGGSGCGL